MERCVPLCRLALVLAMAMVMAASVHAQITPCSQSILNVVFTPCMSFLTNSSANGTSPTAACCNSVKSLASGGMDCLCLVVTANVPFSVPINRTLAISLPRACKLPGVPVQCKTSGSPLPAPGPVSLGSSAPTEFTPSLSPEGSSVLPSPTTPSLAPQSDTTPPPLSTPPVDSASTGRSGLIPSSAMSSYSFPSSVVLVVLGFAILKHY